MDTTNLRWKCQHFNDLTANELYEILRLRSEIFVVEQHCVYLDMDGKDRHAWHVTGTMQGELVAVTRLLPEGISYPGFVSIGRVVNLKKLRGTGIGKNLINKSIDCCRELFGNKPIKIGAQLYLKTFYESLGFIQSGEVYDEDGIPHIEMVLENR